MKVIIISLLFSFLACESDKDHQQAPVAKSKYHSDISSLIKQTEKLEEKMALDIILRSATSRQRISMTALLREIKTALFVLNERPSDQDTLTRLLMHKKNLEAIPMQRRDREFLMPLINDLNQLLLKISEAQRTTLTDLRWKLWSENFNQGMGLFTTFTDKDAWQAGNRNRQGYVSVRSNNTEAWLISPLINLSGIINPAFRLNHLVNIKRNPNYEIDSKLINEKALKVLVSTDYEFGDPNQAHWQRLNMPKFNLITDFNSSWTPPININQFKGKTVTIALKLDLDSNEIGGHGLLWQLNELEILGASNNTNFITARKDPTIFIYQHDFSNGIGAFTQNPSGENPAIFEEISRNEQTYLQINGFKNKSNGVNFLTSPIIELGQANYSLKLTQAINFYNQPAKDKKYIQILVGIEAEEIEWIPLNFSQVPNGDNWNPVESEWLSLDFKNQKIRLGFRYESGNGITEYPNWSLYNINVRQDD